MTKQTVNKPSKRLSWSGSFSTVLSISLVLFVFGLFFVFGYNARNFSNDVRENFEFKVNMLSSTSEEDALALKSKLDSSILVKSVKYISKDEAAKIFSKDLGDDFVSFLGFNPLYPSLEVKLKADVVEQGRIDLLALEVASNPSVVDVDYNKNVIQELNTLLYYIGLGILIFAVILFVVVIALINSNIRLAVYGQRYAIRSMQLVGAKFGFIIRPFFAKSLQLSLLGGFIALLALSGLIYWVDNNFKQILNLQENIVFYSCVMGGLLLLGILFTVVSTYISVGNHIRMKNHKY